MKETGMLRFASPLPLRLAVVLFSYLFIISPLCYMFVVYKYEINFVISMGLYCYMLLCNPLTKLMLLHLVRAKK